MEIHCKCGLGCVKKSSATLKDIEDIYKPCVKCFKPKLKKFKPLNHQINLDKLNANYGRCDCGKRHLDLVMAHALKIMMDHGLRSTEETLRNCCTPLITPAYPSTSIPYLSENSVVILTDKIDEKSSIKIVEEVPEIKGVLKGNIKDIVGLKDANSTPNVYKLLAGCDMRCDVVSTNKGPICIYRNQAKLHVEFSKPVSPKIQILEKYLYKYENPKVMDCTCGPGTLGIASLKCGANKVVFNDIWYPSVEMTMLNLEVNGFKTEFLNSNKSLVGTGDNFEIYCCDIMELKDFITEKFDLCIVDTFPGVDTKEFVDAVKHFCNEVVVI